MKKLGYLGPPGTFSHTAAMQYAAGKNLLPVCCFSLETVFHQIQTGQMDAGIAPAENSTGGTVAETLDLLSAVDSVFITGELILPVRQHLLARPDVKLQDIKRVYSHPQALLQCKRGLQDKLPGVPLTETASTAAAAFLVSVSDRPPAAAVGSISAAENYGLEVLCPDIQDSGNSNVTRFLVLEPKKATPDRGPVRTSMALAVKDRPGALYYILREFALHKISLTRIESRPGGNKLGDYIFFIDFLGREDDPSVRMAISAIGEFVLWQKLFGSYPVYRDASEPAADEFIPGDQTVSLADIREKIDLVDNELLHLLIMRQRLVEEVARLKAGQKQVVDHRREEEIISRIKESAAANNLDPAITEQIYRLIIHSSVLRQKQLLSL
ncbi:MAG: prephenate dehydratase [Firmicutes bacterium]|nr:prephenate dehydratase [Bacillota bacterium]